MSFRGKKPETTIMRDRSLDVRTLFEKQIDCIVRDDREAQARLYAEDVLYEFPFATDRPRRIEGRDAFLAVMQPLWQLARQRHVKVTGYRGQDQATTDPDFIVAECVFDIEIDGRTIEGPFVQFFRAHGGKIVAVREYFSAAARSEALGQT
jgi:ketosteroid isomerase-like protein